MLVAGGKAGSRLGGCVGRLRVRDARVACGAGRRGQAGSSARPAGYWKKAENRKVFLDTVKAKFNVQEAADWRQVRYSDVVAMGGRGLLGEGSLLAVLQEAYPEMGISRKHRPHVPRRFFEEAANRRTFLEEVAEAEGVREAEEWARVPYATIAAMGGKRLLARYATMQEMLADVFPEEAKFATWASWHRVPKRHFEKEANCRAFLEQVGKELGVVQWPDDWRNVTYDQVAERGGRMLLSKYGGLHEALRQLYPAHTWDVFACRTHVPSGYWAAPDNVVAFIHRLADELGITAPQEWYRVSQAQVASVPGGSGLLARVRLADALALAYPKEEWDDDRCARRVKKSSQWMLWRMARKLYPGYEVAEEHRVTREELAACGDSGAALELDVYVPELRLALEYQGIHHYVEVPVFGSLSVYLERDRRKRELCERLGVRLLSVPYWWDNKIGSLAATIAAFDASLLEQEPKGSEEENERQREVVAGVAQGCFSPIAATPPVSLGVTGGKQRRGAWAAQVWSRAVDPAGKLWTKSRGGIRVFWSGEELATQQGRKVAAPAWWLAQLPQGLEVDGELWLGYGRLQELVTRTNLARNWGVEQAEEEEGWRDIRFVAQDTPDVSLPFAKRQERLQEVEENEVVVVERYEECGGREELQAELRRSMEEDGCGLLLYEADGVYQYGKSFSRANCMRVQEVHEAYVEMVAPAARSRWLVVQHGDKKVRQIIRCSLAEYQQPPAPGTRLLVAHMGQWGTSGRLKYPGLLAVHGKE